MNERLLKFRLMYPATDSAWRTVWKAFFPDGQTVLNSTEWRGKEPRSCGVVNIRGNSLPDGGTIVADVTVAYRPKGYTYFVGDTKYDGWTAMMVQRLKDGTLLDGEGKPLAPGAPLVYKPVEIFKDVDFNAIDFGEFIEEVDGAGVQRMTHVKMMEQFHDQMAKGEGISGSINSDFIAPKRHRPHTKIILSSRPSGEMAGEFGDRIINININSPHIRQEIRDQIERVMTEFLEGRASLTTLATSKMVFVELSKALVDCTPNESGQESRFNILNEYVSVGYLEELAKRLMANYRITVGVVEDQETGLLITPEPPDKKQY